jgi:hypothetical protein
MVIIIVIIIIIIIIIKCLKETAVLPFEFTAFAYVVPSMH